MKCRNLRAEVYVDQLSGSSPGLNYLALQDIGGELRKFRRVTVASQDNF